VVRFFGGAIFLCGMFLMAYNVWKTANMAPAPETVALDTDDATQVMDDSPKPVNEPSETLPNEQSLESVAKPKGAFAIAQPLSDNNPKYPRRAIIRNQQGRVKVSFLVDKSGYVDNIELIESSGYALLDDSVFRFAEQERFVPATQDGLPIASNQSYLFRFVLQ
jgi:TonB family protein